MARPGAEARLCFYPAAPFAIDQILTHLRTKPPNPDRKQDTTNILDPCAGKGLALKQIQEGLGVPAETTYAVELDAGRAAEVKANIPGCQLLGPASFLGVQITGHSFGLAYVNPPFSDELGGGRREEQAFAEKATRLLATKGILVLVCPLRALNANLNFCEFIDSHFEDVRVYKFPDGEDDNGVAYRRYNEIVVFGKKRKDQVPKDLLPQFGMLHQMQMHWGYIVMDHLPAIGQKQPKSWQNGSAPHDHADEIRTWEIPHAWKPHTFKKTMFTDAELFAAIDASPLNKHLLDVHVSQPARPPLPLDKGHLGLILASGMLNGIVEGPHGNHVVRGSSTKVEYHNVEQSQSEANPETGAVTTRDVYSERMVTILRAVEQDGNIRTFSNRPEETAEEESVA